jgi:hypothetical protein
MEDYVSKVLTMIQGLIGGGAQASPVQPGIGAAAEVGSKTPLLDSLYPPVKYLAGHPKATKTPTPITQPKAAAPDPFFSAPGVVGAVQKHTQDLKDSLKY